MTGMRDHNDVFRILNRQFNKALRDYHLINNGDKVLVALSGGKDSSSFWKCWHAEERCLSPSSRLRLSISGWRTFRI